MSKELRSSLWHVILAGFFLMFGLLYLLMGLLRYTFVSSLNWAILSIFICAVIALFTIKGAKNGAEQTKLSVAAALCLPLFALFYVVTKGIVSDIHGLSLILLSYVSVGCAIKLFFFCVCLKGLKIVFSVLYALILVPMFLFSLVILFGTVFMGDFGRNEVESAEISPNAVYLAEIVSSNQGALGGHTAINITEKNRNINLFIGELQSTPQMIYLGSWWEHKYMSLHWESDDILCVYLRGVAKRFLRQGRNWVQN